MSPFRHWWREGWVFIPVLLFLWLWGSGCYWGGLFLAPSSTLIPQGIWHLWQFNFSSISVLQMYVLGQILGLLSIVLGHLASKILIRSKLIKLTLLTTSFISVHLTWAFMLFHKSCVCCLGLIFDSVVGVNMGGSGSTRIWSYQNSSFSHWASTMTAEAASLLASRTFHFTTRSRLADAMSNQVINCTLTASSHTLDSELCPHLWCYVCFFWVLFPNTV